MTEQFRHLFTEKIVSLNEKKGLSSTLISPERYGWIIHRVKELNGGQVAKKGGKDYRLLKSYDVERTEVHDIVIERLFKPGTNLVYCHINEIFDVVHEIHLSNGHGARDIMHHEAKKRYANVTREILQMYCELCEECQLKKNKVRKSLVIKPIVSTALNSRCQVDLIDMQSQKDGEFRHILNYQDHLTKFVILKPLVTKQTIEVAKHLIEIFCLFGCPLILQSDNGREFASAVVKEVTESWPNCKLVHGKPRHSQSQGSVERANQDVQNTLACWMKENNKKKWSSGLKYVQLAKNNRFHSGINTTPYAAMFSQETNGLKSLNLPNGILERLESEEDLEAVISNYQRDQGNSEESTQTPQLTTPSTPATSFKLTENVLPSESESDDNEEEDIDRNSVDGERSNCGEPTKNVFEVLTRAGITPEIVCPCCDHTFLGQIKCADCEVFCHELPTW